MNTRKVIKVDNQQQKQQTAADKENIKPRKYLENEIGKLSQQSMEAQQLYEEEVYRMQTSQEYAKNKIPLHLKEYFGARMEQLLNADVVDSADDQHKFDVGEAKKKCKEVGEQIRLMRKAAQNDEKIRAELQQAEMEKEAVIAQLEQKASILQSFLE